MSVQPTPPETLRILLIEDSATDAELIERELRRTGLAFAARRVETAGGLRAALEDFAPDLVLSDLAMPVLDGMEALRITREIRPAVPFIFASGTIGEERAIDLLKCGATDYVLKDNLPRLAPVVNRALREVDAERGRRTTEEQLRWKTALLEAQVNSDLDGLLVVDGSGRKVLQNQRLIDLWKLPREIIDDPDGARHLRFAAAQTRHPARFLERAMELYAHPDEIGQDTIELVDGTVLDRYSSPVRDVAGKYYGRIWAFRDITARRQAEAAFAALQKELIAASRFAGMAEVAAEVLHNVGNVLNSANISAALLGEHIRKSKAGNLGRVVALLEAHADDLGAYLTHDPQGGKLVGYLGKLHLRLEEEQRDLAAEVESLQQSIKHLSEIVAMQQAYTNYTAIAEEVQIGELIEETLRLNVDAASAEGTRVVLEFAAVPALTLERQKVAQILAHLVRNARQACADAASPESTVTVRLSREGPCVQVAICDTGVGIAPETLRRIFNPGFTTKRDGHGFGLHCSANAAREMGGSLTAVSAGPGLGATFILLLPCPPPAPSL